MGIKLLPGQIATVRNKTTRSFAAGADIRFGRPMVYQNQANSTVVLVEATDLSKPIVAIAGLDQTASGFDRYKQYDAVSAHEDADVGVVIKNGVTVKAGDLAYLDAGAEFTNVKGTTNLYMGIFKEDMDTTLRTANLSFNLLIPQIKSSIN